MILYNFKYNEAGSSLVNVILWTSKSIFVHTVRLLLLYAFPEVHFWIFIGKLYAIFWLVIITEKTSMTMYEYIHEMLALSTQ
jgi:hypothetical protein